MTAVCATVTGLKLQWQNEGHKLYMANPTYSKVILMIYTPTQTAVVSIEMLWNQPQVTV